MLGRSAAATTENTANVALARITGVRSRMGRPQGVGR